MRTGPFSSLSNTARIAASVSHFLIAITVILLIEVRGKHTYKNSRYCLSLKYLGVCGVREHHSSYYSQDKPAA